MGEFLPFLLLLLPFIAIVVLFVLGFRTWFGKVWQRRAAAPLAVFLVRKFTLGPRASHLFLARRWWFLPRFLPGQYVSVRIPLPGGGELHRSYSLAAWKPFTRTFELGIKQE